MKKNFSLPQRLWAIFPIRGQLAKDIVRAWKSTCAQHGRQIEITDFMRRIIEIGIAEVLKTGRVSDQARAAREMAERQQRMLH